MKGMIPCAMDWEKRPARPCRCETSPPLWYEDCRNEPCRRPCCDPAMRVRLFDGDRCAPCACRDRPLPPAAPPVTVVNPWNCRERAEVTLSVDECGNLVVYIRR